MKTPIIFSPENESKAIAWLTSRGGIAVWSNKDLGSASLSAQTFAPALSEEGTPMNSPHWSNGNTPDGIITDPSLVIVQTYREVSRVKIRRGPPYLGCVNRADRPRLDAALEKAGEGASWVEDYSNRGYRSSWFEAVISVPDITRPLALSPVVAT